MENDNYDDGLVHSHHWAKEPPQPGIIVAPRPVEVHDPVVAAAMARKDD